MGIRQAIRKQWQAELRPLHSLLVGLSFDYTGGKFSLTSIQQNLTDTQVVFAFGIHDSCQKEGAGSAIRCDAAPDRLHEVGRNATGQVPVRSVSLARFFVLCCFLTDTSLAGCDKLKLTKLTKPDKAKLVSSRK